MKLVCRVNSTQVYVFYSESYENIEHSITVSAQQELSTVHLSNMISESDCCVSLVSTRKEVHWCVRFFSLLTLDNEEYVQQTNKQNWILNSNEQKALRSIYISIQTKERPGKENNQNVPEQLDQESSITFEI